MRPLKITPVSISTAEGSVLIELGKTRVIGTATVDDGVPGFLKGSGKGWVTCEYGMLPRATEERTAREATRGKQSGRTLEIQRLIGRSLRAVTDQEALAERTVWLDCDVIQADGGTRTASITGAPVKLYLASSNPGKLAEFRELAGTDASGVTLELELLPKFESMPRFEETAPTFAENAVGKALHYSRLCDGFVFADDSGLVVPAL